MAASWNVQQVQGEIIAAALKQGVDPVLALAIAHQEDASFNPARVGDNGTSFGIYQLHRGGELGNLTPEEAFNVSTNANVALKRVHQVAVTHPHFSAGEIAYLAQRPSASVKNQYISGVNSAYQAYMKNPPPALVAQIHQEQSNLPNPYSGGPLPTNAGARVATGNPAQGSPNIAQQISNAGAGVITNTTQFFQSVGASLASIGAVSDWILKLSIPSNFTRVAAGIWGSVFILMGIVFVAKGTT